MSQTFGASLRDARERKGISLRQIATATKISIAALESLERNDFSKLPGGIFSRAFVRSYAIEVGLDPDETVHQYLRQFESEPGSSQRSEDEVVEAPHHLAQKPRPAVRPTDLTPEFDFESRQRTAAVVLKLVVVSIPIAAAILYFGSRVSAPGRQPEPTSVPEQSVAQQPARAQPAARPLAPTASTPLAPAPPARPAGGEITIEIAPSGDCWARLTTDGSVVVSRILKPGERETRSFRQSAVLQVGDAAACAILINGRPARPLGPPQRVREIHITPDNYTTFLP